ncbi:hypothetical protein [Halonotius sp. GCM10025705]|uniref:hypothetical protein n=1 Tax=Halonotius sp. GCM10025705 TaxID=3252678 RepID=UPI003607A954
MGGNEVGVGVVGREIVIEAIVVGQAVDDDGVGVVVNIGQPLGRFFEVVQGSPRR